MNWPRWWPYRPDPRNAEFRAELDIFEARADRHVAYAAEMRAYLDARGLVTDFYTWRLAKARLERQDEEKTP